MKILYAIQGTGNGHVARAIEIIPILKSFAQTDLFISGQNCEVRLPYEVKYRSKGATFFYNNNGGIDFAKTFTNMRLGGLTKEVLSFPVQNYDLVINDFEFITAYACKLKSVPLLAIGHQSAFFSDKSPRPKQKSALGEFILKHYAPAPSAIGFHFKPYDSFIYTPVIRRQVRDLFVSDFGHITVYLSAFDDDFLLPILNRFNDFKFEVFSKKSKFNYRIGNCIIKPVENESFLRSMATCQGLITGAGFEGPAEAMFLGKKLFCIPINGQYEQYCNAESLKDMNVPVVENLNNQNIIALRNWLYGSQSVQVNYPDKTSEILENALFGKSNLLQTKAA